jgi:hypothetical protein
MKLFCTVLYICMYVNVRYSPVKVLYCITMVKHVSGLRRCNCISVFLGTLARLRPGQTANFQLSYNARIPTLGWDTFISSPSIPGYGDAIHHLTGIFKSME